MNIRKLLAFLLCLCMVMALLPVTAMAEEELVPEEELAVEEPLETEPDSNPVPETPVEEPVAEEPADENPSPESQLDSEDETPADSTSRIVWRYRWQDLIGDESYHSEPIPLVPGDAYAYENYYWLYQYDLYYYNADQGCYSQLNPAIYPIDFSCSDGSIYAKCDSEGFWRIYPSKSGEGTFSYTTGYPAVTYTLNVKCALPSVGLYKTDSRTVASYTGFRCYWDEPCTGYLIFKKAADAPATAEELQIGRITGTSGLLNPVLDTDKVEQDAVITKVSDTVFSFTFTPDETAFYTIADAQGNGIIGWSCYDNLGTALYVSENGSPYIKADNIKLKLTADPTVYENLTYQLLQPDGTTQDVTAQMTFASEPEGVITAALSESGWTVSINGAAEATLSYNSYSQKFTGKFDTFSVFYTSAEPVYISDRIWGKQYNGPTGGIYEDGATTVYALLTSGNDDYSADQLYLTISYADEDGFYSANENLDPTTYTITRLEARKYRIDFIAEPNTQISLKSTTSEYSAIGDFYVYEPMLYMQYRVDDPNSGGWSMREPYNDLEPISVWYPDNAMRFVLIDGPSTADIKDVTSAIAFTGSPTGCSTWGLNTETGLYELHIVDAGTATFKYKTGEYDFTANLAINLPDAGCYTSQTASAATLLQELKLEDTNSFYIIFNDERYLDYGLLPEYFYAEYMDFPNQYYYEKTQVTASAEKISDLVFKMTVSGVPVDKALQVYYDQPDGCSMMYVTEYGDYHAIHTVATDLSECDVKLSYTSKACTGSALKPTVTVKYPSGAVVPAASYTVSYSNNTNVGKASVTVTANAGGILTGSVTKTFNINPKDASIKSIANTKDGIKLTWGKVTGATGYKIYRSIGTAGYKLIKTCTSGSTVSYTSTGSMTGGTKYRFKIVAVQKVDGTEYTSAESKVKTIYRLSRPAISSVENTSTGIKVTWGKVTGATGYKLYRSTGTGSYKLIKTITSGSTVSYSDTGATTNGTRYRYKIVAVKTVSGTPYTSAESAVKTMYRLSRPTISSATSKEAGKITVKWGKNDKATGYQIKYVKGTTEKTITVTSKATVSKVLSSLTKGATYKISIRSYKTVDGTKYYSAWSAAKSVKVS